jgi:hypothetical protein
MKKITTSLLVCLAITAIASVLAFAAAQKVDFVPCPINYPDSITLPLGGGFVIYNNPAGSDHNLDVTVSLKGVERNTAYDLYLFVDDDWYNGAKVGTVTTNRQGNATFHMNGLLSPGIHVLTFDVTLAGTFADIYETPGIHQSEGVSMNFR